VDPGEARGLWHLLETLHAVTYFAPGCRAAAEELGFKGFWMGYFGCRAAPLGPVGAGPVTATFFNFHPDKVARAIPDAWDHVAPEQAIAGRAAAAAEALRAATSDMEDVLADIAGALEVAVDAADAAGRPLFAANREVDPFEDPVADAWQLVTTLREHRGDGHVACLTAEGLGGCDTLVLFAASEGIPDELLRTNRGWSEEEWAASRELLAAAGLLDGAGTGAVLTERGTSLRRRIEDRTDELAAAPYAALRPERRDEVAAALVHLADAVLASVEIPFPNPMGLPRAV
jgi:hypothetical protein